MRISQRIRQGLYSTGLALGGIILYVPAAIGLAISEIARRPEADDNRWRFVLPGTEQCLGPTARTTDLWAHMNLMQYFSLLPGVTALDRGNCAFSRPCYG